MSEKEINVKLEPDAGGDAKELNVQMDSQTYDMVRADPDPLIESIEDNAKDLETVAIVDAEEEDMSSACPTCDDNLPKQPVVVEKSEPEKPIIRIQLPISAAMDNYELECVRQTPAFVMGFFSSFHEHHFHNDKRTFNFGKATIIEPAVPKIDECVSQFHAAIEGRTNEDAKRFAELVTNLESELMPVALKYYHQYLNMGKGVSAVKLNHFRELINKMLGRGISWRSIAVLLLFTYLVCLSDEAKSFADGSNFVQSLVTNLVAERKILWVSRHGGWARSSGGLKTQRVMQHVCAAAPYALLALGVGGLVGFILFRKQR